jgi:hypothetical protein
MFGWGPPTSTRVDIATSNNTTWHDAFQFDPPGMSGCGCQDDWQSAGITQQAWGFTNQNFRLDIKGNKEQAVPLLSIWGPTGASNLIQIDDFVNRILNFNVPEGVITGALTGISGSTGVGLVPGEYVYDFIMYDQSVPSVRVALMHGKFRVHDGVTGG